jgi:hypothetical protein
MCMCDSKYPRSSAFKFLEDLKDTFFKTFSQREIDLAISYCLNSSFNDIIMEKMISFNKSEYVTENDNNYDKITIKDCNASDFNSVKTGQANLVVQKAEINEVEKYHKNTIRKSVFIF